MPDKKFTPAKQVVKMRKISIEFLPSDYVRIVRAAHKYKVGMKEIIRQATMFALENLEK